MDKKYWHETPKEERDSTISVLTWEELLAKYQQPDWCGMPHALATTMGCWGLQGFPETISCKSCKSCEFHLEN